jgi:hypothetical protein
MNKERKNSVNRILISANKKTHQNNVSSENKSRTKPVPPLRELAKSQKREFTFRKCDVLNAVEVTSFGASITQLLAFS